MDIKQLVTTALVIVLASFIQSAVGFAFALFSVPALLFLGLSLPQTVGIIMTASMAQRLMAVYHMRASVDWRQLWPLMLVALLGLPVGLYCMYQLDRSGQALTKQVVGGCILLALIVRWSCRVQPRERVPFRWGALAGFVSGVLGGLAGIGGPPIVLWILAHKWSAEKMRVTTLAFTLPFTPALAVAMYFTFGRVVLLALLTGLLFVPLALLGTWMGLAAGGRISRKRLRVIAQALLLLLALYSILQPLVAG